MKISSVSEMRALDKTASEKLLIKEELLMENAGLAASFMLFREYGINNKRFVIICGTGNNGGDGFVIARKVLSNGGLVKVFILGDKNGFKGVAKLNLDIITKLFVSIQEIDSPGADLMPEISNCDVIVDALFGTGLARDVKGKYREVIEIINSSGKAVLSVDIPSGVNGDTGQIMGIAVNANYTVTFGLPKIGNLLYPGYDLCGKLSVTHISFPPSIYNADSIKVELNLPPELPPRAKEGHKGTFGQALFIAGAASYFGAPYFAASSFLKAGGGYSSLAAPFSIIPFIAAKGSEIVFVRQKETPSGSISMANKEELLKLIETMDMVVLGPGISLDPETGQLVRELSRQINKPLLLDGDGITALSEDLDILKNRTAPTVITPHLGEMSRITKKGITEIKSDPIGIMQFTSRKLNAIIVLKGPHSLIGLPDQRVFINMTGNSGAATAGAGDVLTGTIAAMTGLGLSVPEAVRKGVLIHGLAADLAAQEKGEDGITAQDILNFLPLALKNDREGTNIANKSFYSKIELI